MKSIITYSSAETKKLGRLLANQIMANQKRPSLFRLFGLRPACWRGREARPLIICLEGELGSGKTTFAQGLLKGLGVKGPYTSPTFVVMKQYKLTTNNLRPTTKKPKRKKLSVVSCQLLSAYHFDAYRVTAKDILNLGWKEIISNPKNIIIIEWADRIKKIIPRDSLWIKFKWIDKNRRRIKINNKTAKNRR